MKNIKAYNEDWINNKYILKKMGNWQILGLISSQKLTEAQEKLKVGFKQYNIFAKIGLFIFSWVAITSAGSILALTFLEMFKVGDFALQILTIIFSITLFFLLEIVIAKGDFYRSGADNLILYTATSGLILSVCQIFGFDLGMEFYFLIAAIVLATVTIKYGDPIISIGLFVVFVGFVFTIVTKSDIGKVIIPFVLMSIAAVIYIINDKLLTSIYYHSCHKVFKTSALVLFYISGNYFVVREGNAQLANFSTSVEIPFAWIFWVFTFGIPVVYLTYALKTKDRLMLHLGILGLAVSILTYRNYYQLLPLEIAICLIGGCLIVITIALNRWLKIERRGIISNPTRHSENAEALLVSEVIQSKLGDTNSGKFGGGSFGGGGAGSNY
jgi:uncharacterized membrane protein YgcG